jgi:DNA end-binding protein Ku
MAVSWKGSISFGTATIPVSLTLAAGEESIGFNLIHKGCGGRANWREVCSLCGRELGRDEIIKGYNYEDGRYVLMDDDEFDMLKSPGDRTIPIERFVEAREIDPAFYEKAYYVVPEDGKEAFAALREAMEREDRVGIAKTVMGARECLVALRAANGALMLHTLYFPSEIRAAPAVQAGPAPAEGVRAARELMVGMAGPFRPEIYRDEYPERLREAIRRKEARRLR